MMLLSTDVPDCLARHTSSQMLRDEENHDLALGYIADAYGVDEKAEAEAYGSQRSVDEASRSHGTQSNGCRACNLLRSSTILSI